ncbi:MAG TPA: peptidylprolyl isomerase [Ignavibacteriaceae bacterium]|nr:peptidylprolyl isomerase [Ignavibacteriaceae bacterium]
MSINVQRVIKFSYTLRDEQGNILDSTEKSGALSFLTGSGQIIPKLEEELSVMLIGSKKNIHIDAQDAYGEYESEAIQTVKRIEFPEDMNLEIGQSYYANTPDGGQMPFLIKEINDDEVIIDFNHPLAGVNLDFDVQLVDVRDATQEEISHGHVHGANDNHHH